MSKITKRASAPTRYNDAIRVDLESVKNSEALITSGGVHEAIEAATPRTDKIDFSKWDQGQFVEYLSNDKIIIFKVIFDENDRPIQIIDHMDNAMDIIW